MSFTLIDFFNGFQSLKEKRRFSAGAQSTYFAILAKFNSAHYPATLPITTRDLQIDAGLKSVATAHECRNVLKNNKLIDFRTLKGTTIYRLLTEHLPNKKSVSAEQQPNANRTAEGLLNLPAHVEVVEVEKKKEEEGACVREEDVVKATNPTTEDDIFKVWAENAMPYLGAEQKYELLGYVEDETYGFEKVKAAILAVRDKRQFPTFADFRKELTVKGKPKTQDNPKTTGKATRQNNTVTDVLKVLD